MDQLSSDESSDTAVHFYHKVLKKPATTAEIVGLSRYIRNFPDTIDRANAKVEKLRVRERRMVRTMSRLDDEIQQLRDEKDEALEKVESLQSYQQKYSDMRRKLKLEKEAYEGSEQLYSEKLRELRAKLIKRDEQLRHSETVIATLCRQIGNAAAEFRSKFPGRNMYATNSSCEAQRSSSESSSLNTSSSSTSTSAAPTSDEASITAVAGSPPPSLDTKSSE